jgi:DNA-binding XRE family transcriptional regulator
MLISKARKGATPLKGGVKMTLQDQMIAYRAKNGLTQADLAKKCGLSTMTINQIENGYQKPSKVTLAKIRFVVGKEGN